MLMGMTSTRGWPKPASISRLGWSVHETVAIMYGGYLDSLTPHILDGLLDL
jgi:hypothetical protein